MGHQRDHGGKKTDVLYSTAAGDTTTTRYGRCASSPAVSNADELTQDQGLG